MAQRAARRVRISGLGGSGPRPVRQEHQDSGRAARGLLVHVSRALRPRLSGARQIRRHVSGLDQEPAQIVRVSGERVSGDEPGRGLRGHHGAPAVDEAGQAADRVGRVRPVPVDRHREPATDRSERVHRGSVRGLSDADLGGEVSVRPGEHREPDLERGVGSILHAALAADHAALGAGRRLGRPALRRSGLHRGFGRLLHVAHLTRRPDDQGRALGAVQGLDAHPASVVHLPRGPQRGAPCA